ncbi:hypothetical protein GW17_00051501 [Ensete ventricosum]|nr:hypothetical protein GW17_00051501 [Ensete ventricosum]
MLGQSQVRALDRGSDDAMRARQEFAEGDREARWEHTGSSSKDDRETHRKFTGGCQEDRRELGMLFDMSVTNDYNWVWSSLMEEDLSWTPMGLDEGGLREADVCQVLAEPL